MTSLELISNLDSLPPDLKFQVLDDIAGHMSQSARAAAQLKLLRWYESGREQGKRTDLDATNTCTSDDAQVKPRRPTSVEKVGKHYGEGHETVRCRLLVLESARKDPGRYGKYLRQMDEENSPFAAARAIKSIERAEKARHEKLPEPPIPVVRHGDLWLLDRHRLVCGNATQADDVGRLLDGAKPLLMVTDPPYGVGYDSRWRRFKAGNKNSNKMGTIVNDDRADWSAAWKLFPGDVAYVWYADIHDGIVQAGLKNAGLETRQMIVWKKPRPVLGWGNYQSQKETCWYSVRKGRPAPWYGGRSQSDVWEIDNREDAGHGHPTQKPVDCMLRPIENNSIEGDEVYDPFVGCGTTIVAAERSGRCCYAMDIDPMHCTRAIQRWQNETGQQAVLLSTGQTFDGVSRDRAMTAITDSEGTDNAA